MLAVTPENGCAPDERGILPSEDGLEGGDDDGLRTGDGLEGGDKGGLLEGERGPGESGLGGEAEGDFPEGLILGAPSDLRTGPCFILPTVASRNAWA